MIEKANSRHDGSFIRHFIFIFKLQKNKGRFEKVSLIPFQNCPYFFCCLKIEWNIAKKRYVFDRKGNLPLICDMTVVLLDILFNKSIGKKQIFFQTLAKNRVPLGITAKNAYLKFF